MSELVGIPEDRFSRVAALGSYMSSRVSLSFTPLKIISAHMRRANPWMGLKNGTISTHQQAELALSSMYPVRCSKPHQSQR